jgi:hypothetical protein
MSGHNIAKRAQLLKQDHEYLYSGSHEGGGGEGGLGGLVEKTPTMYSKGIATSANVKRMPSGLVHTSVPRYNIYFYVYMRGWRNAISQI